MSIFSALGDLLISIAPVIITAIVSTGGIAFVGWKFLNKASGRIAKITTAIHLATNDGKLTGDEINAIIDSFKGDLDKAKAEIRQRTIERTPNRIRGIV